MSESVTEILLLSGPNLNLLGAREPEIYGTETLENHVETAKNAAARHGLSLHHEQSNHEGELIEFIHQVFMCTSLPHTSRHVSLLTGHRVRKRA
jgi:3-dehydroquinate dehydratase-2